MGRSLNGTSDHMEVALDLSGQSVITVSFWWYFPTNYNNNLHAFFEYGNANWTIGGWIFTPWSSNAGNSILVGFGDATGANIWTDTCPLEAASTWHHGLLLLDRGNKVNQFYANGTKKAMTASTHNAATYGNFANSVLNIGSRNGGGSLFGALRIAELAIWKGDVRGVEFTVSGGTTACSLSESLTNGHPAPFARPSDLLLYSPFIFGDSPDIDMSGNSHTVTVTGTSKVNHPRTRTTLTPSCVSS
jgi:hypothetical protein